jgi:NADH:ubiquinone oxidoreductase subunit 6 (subunit J)
MTDTLSQAAANQFVSGAFWYPLAFVLFALGTLVPAVLVVLSRNIVHSALWLLASLASVAGLFLLLGAEFLAAIQILVYCGGIVVLFLFAIMLTPGVGDPDVRAHNQQVFWGAIAATLAAAVSLHLLASESWQVVPAAQLAAATNRLADALMGEYVLAFEVASVVLLVAMVGAIVIVRSEPQE